MSEVKSNHPVKCVKEFVLQTSQLSSSFCFRCLFSVTLSDLNYSKVPDGFKIRSKIRRRLDFLDYTHNDYFR